MSDKACMGAPIEDASNVNLDTMMEVHGLHLACEDHAFRELRQAFLHSRIEFLIGQKVHPNEIVSYLC